MGPFSLSLYLYVGLALFSLLVSAVTVRVNPFVSLLFAGSFVYFVANAIRVYREEPYDLKRLKKMEEGEASLAEVVCPYCGEIYREPLGVCPHCGRSVNT
jgi:hypothetical protein